MTTEKKLTAEEELELTNQKITQLETKLAADKVKMAKIVAETIKLNQEMEDTKAELDDLRKKTKEKAVDNNTALTRVENEYDEVQAQILQLEKILKIT